MTDPAARAALERADTLTAEVLRRWPTVWTLMDRMRAHPPQDTVWPDWCLLPMAAAQAVTMAGWTPGMPIPPIGAVSALYAWRHSSSVYLVHPDLMGRLLGQVPDAVDLDLVRGLPEWCVYVADPGAAGGLWMHLEHDVGTGRPELRLLLDLGSGGLDELLAVPLYLDRPSVTEALADMRATAVATTPGVAGADVHGGPLDADVAELAERVDAYVGIAAYLARPQADILGPPGVRPARLRRPATGRRVWRVGYGR